MSTTKEKLEAAFTKVRALPEDRQEAALEALIEIADEPYQLTNEELSVLKPALARAKRGEVVDDADMEEVLDKPWT